MKKSFVGPLVTSIVLVVILAGFAYFYLQLNRMNKKMNVLQTTISQNSSKVSGIVSFFNANINSNRK